MDVSDMLPMSGTYWPPAGNDGFGNVGAGSPSPLACRYETKRKLMRGKDGREFMSEGVVFCAEDLAIGGRFKLGTYEGAPPADALEVRVVSISPSIDGGSSLCEATV